MEPSETLESLLGGPVSGASMNPPRSTWSRVGERTRSKLSGSIVTALVLGALLTDGGCRPVRDSECCNPSNANIQTGHR